MVTIRDVARRARVSVATVSRVYNHSPLVREETRQRVYRAAQRLGYSPHGAARSLVTHRTHTIGVLLQDLYGAVLPELIRGIEHTAQARGYHLLVSTSRTAGETLAVVLRSMRGRVDGLILMTPDNYAATAGSAFKLDFPVVLLNCPPADVSCDSLGTANYDGAVAMIRHLAALGHRRIAMIRGSEQNFDAAERLRGYRAAVRKLGLASDAALELPGDFTEAAGFAAAKFMVDTGLGATAVFAANDCMAFGALSAFEEVGLDVPGQMAVAGFDDIPMARYAHPALTTVRVDFSDLGQRATDRLLTALQAPATHRPRRENVPTMLAVRRSCGAALS